MDTRSPDGGYSWIKRTVPLAGKHGDEVTFNEGYTTITTLTSSMVNGNTKPISP